MIVSVNVRMCISLCNCYCATAWKCVKVCVCDWLNVIVWLREWLWACDCVHVCDSKSNQIKSNQITFIVTSQHMCLGEWNSWERAPNRNNLHTYYTVHTYRLIQKTMCRIHIHIVSTHSVLLRHTYSYQYTLYTVCTHSTFCTHIYTIICEGAADYT